MNLHIVSSPSPALHPGLSDLRPIQAIARGGLAPWQQKRISRFIAINLGASIPVTVLAAIAKLSNSHFSRAFRVTFGVSPHAMLCRLRIAEAMRLMLGTDWPLGQIASSCGFSDQSHFSRVFQRQLGTTPGRWRRDRLSRLLASSA
jgi:AraC family transcriptional regulator